MPGRHLTRRVQTVLRRSVSVIAWGGNKSGQCGTQSGRVLLQPATSLADLDADPENVAVGRQHSGAVLSNGEVLVWGCGQAGKLGLGTTHDVQQPTRVEAFVGRNKIKSVAFGHQHSLFLDAVGQIHTCGENKEGQCGLGTSLEAIAGQRRQEWAAGIALGLVTPVLQAERRQSEPETGARLSMRTPMHGDAQPAGDIRARLAAMQPSSSAPFGQQQERLQELLQAQQLWSGRRPKRKWESPTPQNMLMPGQLHTPARLGRDLNSPLQPQCSSQAGPAAQLSAPAVQVAASRFFSTFIDVSGQVFTFGGGYNGELGHAAAWAPSARPVTGEVQQALEDNGGAVEIAVGSTFCLCRTGNGGAVVWGGLPGAGSLQHSGTSHERKLLPRGMQVAEVMGMPPIKHIAAGHGHALLSDGERVWALGQWLSANGESKIGLGWGHGPQEVLHVPDQGIASVSAGLHSCAAITTSGQLYLWGSVLNKDQAEYLAADTQKQSDVLAIQEQWGWAGLGADSPKQVPGLSCVRSIALGAQHAIAIVE